ncbi:MAG: nickel-responsive transcriptional regulator NikR [Fimbriimonadaceae bacterium]|nr:nickel-responsive transcriptional regulator NikR [Fimbriimonadaceae bacterium]
MALERFGVSMDEELLRAFDGMLQRKGWENRSEALRDLVRRALVADLWGDDEAQVLGAVTIVYDHHQRDLTNELLDLQHHADAEIVCATHVHLDHHHCLEVILCRGQAKVVRELADRLIGLRGVSHGDLTLTAGGAVHAPAVP